MTLTALEAAEDRVAATDSATRKADIHARGNALHRRIRDAEQEGEVLRAALELDDADLAALEDRICDLADEVAAAREEMYELVAEAIDGERYTAADVRAWDELSFGMTGSRLMFTAQALDGLVDLERVPNAALREEFLCRTADPEDGITIEMVLAHTYGHLREMEQADGKNYSSRSLLEPSGKPTSYRTFKRWLGVEPPSDKDGRTPALRVFVSYEQAVAIARSLGLSNHEAGI